MPVRPKVSANEAVHIHTNAGIGLNKARAFNQWTEYRMPVRPKASANVTETVWGSELSAEPSVHKQKQMIE